MQELLSEDRFSECCGMKIVGEVDRDGFGRCSKCKEMSGTYKVGIYLGDFKAKSIFVGDLEISIKHTKTKKGTERVWVTVSNPKKSWRSDGSLISKHSVRVCLVKEKGGE
jgi:hypothetical protein